MKCNCSYHLHCGHHPPLKIVRELPYVSHAGDATQTRVVVGEDQGGYFHYMLESYIPGGFVRDGWDGLALDTVEEAVSAGHREQQSLDVNANEMRFTDVAFYARCQETGSPYAVSSGDYDAELPPF